MTRRTEKLKEKQMNQKAEKQPLNEELKVPEIVQEESSDAKKSFDYISDDGSLEHSNVQEDQRSDSDLDDTYHRDYHLRELLKCNTDGFTLTYTELKNRDVFKREPLNQYPKEEIQRVINNERQKIQREKKDGALYKQQTIKQNKLLNRLQAPKPDLDELSKPLKRLKRQDHSIQQPENFFQARFFLNHISMFEQGIQNQIVIQIENFLNSNETLRNIVQATMVRQLSTDALNFYEKEDIRSLIQMFQDIDPKIVILINIQIELTNSSYTEEGHTLSKTLLPFLDKVEDYSFLRQESLYTMTRFVKTLCDHVLDTECHIGKGFLLCCLTIDPSKVQSIIPYSNNKQSLFEALVCSKFSSKTSKLISENYQKLLWPQLLKVISGKDEQIIHDTLKLLIKMNILTDPGAEVHNLLQMFSQRKLLLDCLVNAESIDIGLKVLNRILQIMILSPREVIITTLSQDSKKWESLGIQNSNKGNSTDDQTICRLVDEIYLNMTKDSDKLVSIESLVQISKKFSDDNKEYKHCVYQSFIASVIASFQDQFVIAVSPTGSGKTWIQGLLAKYYCNHGMTVTIIEPNQLLKIQTQEKLSDVDYQLNFQSIEEYYQEGSEADVIIMDEYDIIMQQSPYSLKDNCLVGLWQLKANKVIAFSATSSSIYERYVNNSINKPRILKFLSEYELLNKISPIQEPTLINCKDIEEMLVKLFDQIEKMYDSKPIIVVHDINQETELLKNVSNNKYRYFKGVSKAILDQIKPLDQGILLIEASQSRGVDVRFKMDSIVIIVSHVLDYSQLIQMVGRSSRTRGVCDSFLYVIGEEKSFQLVARLQKEGINDMLALEKLAKLLEKKHNDTTLIAVMKEALKTDSQIRSLEQLKERMKPNLYAKLLK